MPIELKDYDVKLSPRKPTREENERDLVAYEYTPTSSVYRQYMRIAWRKGEIIGVSYVWRLEATPE